MRTSDKKHLFPTVSDVAKLARVSPITVSRVFNPKWAGKVKPATAGAVMQAAQTLHYTPNGVARSLVSQHTSIIAVVIGKSVGYFYMKFLLEISGRMQREGWQVLVFTLDNATDIETVVSHVQRYRVDAIVVTSSVLVYEIPKHFSSINIPVILFKRPATLIGSSGIWCSDQSASKKAARFLVENGHRKIAMIVEPYGETYRDQAFISQLAAYGLSPFHVCEGNYQYGDGYRGALEIMGHGQPDAIFCDEDTMAMGAMDALRGHGLRIPEDVSVMGFDDNPAASLPAYDLTTMAHRLDEMLDAVITAIHQELETPGSRFAKEFDMDLVVRSSVLLNRPQRNREDGTNLKV